MGAATSRSAMPKGAGHLTTKGVRLASGGMPPLPVLAPGFIRSPPLRGSTSTSTRRDAMWHLCSAMAGLAVSCTQAPAAASAFCLGKCAGSSTEPAPSNVFLRILEGELPADVVDGDDDELFAFRDRRPASTVHLLVIPRTFIRDAAQLQPPDAALVRRMESKARALVIDAVGADKFDEAELALGFHWPPWYSVPWLHLHAIYPRSAMVKRYKYTSISFKCPEYVLDRLKAQLRRDRGQGLW